MSEADAFRTRFGVSRETTDRLEHLLTLLRKWSPRINLVSRSTLDDAWTRHVLDSAQLWPLAPASASRWVDLGAGAGFPGLVIAAIAREMSPDLRMTVVESDSRKCAFMANAARELDVSAEIRTRRIESLAPEAFDVVSARALASLPELLALSAPLLAPGGVRLFPKGATAHSELTEARRDWHIEARSHQSVTDPDAVILEIQEAARVTEPRS